MGCTLAGRKCLLPCPASLLTNVHSPKYRLLLTRLKEARLAAEMTQSEVARALGVPQSFVSKCESGERRIDPVELASFADIYQQPFSFFMKGLSRHVDRAG
ncbi:hypothetical protein rosag_19120 [Roseisolibacter agri]|uniref:HTH cro/C1-type domain-containing protein n=2 Tax=Roseisolibacter agri TaxID=2014610 RepID=A0AA37Q2I6_9BACT|nr:hypothetical protein rosag_19120 [Roseisolibacter agri]